VVNVFNNLKIVLAYTPYISPSSTPEVEYNARKMELAAKNIKEALENSGFLPVLLPVDELFLVRVKETSPDLIFNYSTGVQEKNSQVITASLLEKIGLPFTGSGMKTHFIALYKDLTKYILKSKDIPTPAFQVFTNYDEELKSNLSFPLFVKPVHEGSSFGIDQNSVVRNHLQLREKVKEINTIYQQAALVEEFIPGREFTVGVWGNEHPDILPILELSFNNINNINTMENKNKRSMQEICPCFIPEEIQIKIKELAIKAFLAIGCYDYARVDFRMSNEGQLYVIELNTLPSLKADRSSFITMARAAGFEFNQVINKIVSLALERQYSGQIKEVPGL
jgi:D-alanine-D-alanine ligase